MKLSNTCYNSIKKTAYIDNEVILRSKCVDSNQ